MTSRSAVPFGMVVVGSLVSLSVVAAQFKSFETHSHLVIPIDSNVDYFVSRIEKDGKTVGLRVALEGVDLAGKSSALDPANADLRTEKIVITKSRAATGRNERVIYDVILTTRAQAQGVEFFDYRNKAPTEVIVDYWLKSQNGKIQVKTATESLVAKKGRKQKKAAVATYIAPPKATGPAAYGGCGQPLDPAIDGVAFWNVYHQNFDYRAFFDVTPPDGKYTYHVPPKTEQPSKADAHYLLALKLYKDGQYALVLRTIEFFEKQYARHRYLNELQFLKANTLVQLSRLLRTDRYVDQALDVFRHVLLQEPESERANLALAYIVQEYMGRGNAIAALEYALLGADRKPRDANDLSPWVYRLAAAEALAAIGELDRAERNYQLLLDQNNKVSPEAAFRVGELFSTRKLWERATLSYEKALRVFSKEAAFYPSAWLNLAEAYFRMGKLADAERVYRAFEERFPSDPASWAAELRIAELDQMKIKHADVKHHDVVLKSYENVINGNPYTPGAMFAELRLARCWKGLSGDDRTKNFFMNFFKNRELKKMESPLVNMADIEVWFDLTEVGFFADNGEARLVLEKADSYRTRLEKLGGRGASFKKVFSDAVIALVNDLAEKGIEGEGKDGSKNGDEILGLVEHYGGFVAQPEPISYQLSLARALIFKNKFAAAGEQLKQIEARVEASGSGAEKDRYWILKARYARTVGEKSEQILSYLSHVDDTGAMAIEKYSELSMAALDKGDLRASLLYDNHLLDTALAKRLSMDQLIAASARRIDTLYRIKDQAVAAKFADQALIRFGAQTQRIAELNRIRDLRAFALYDLKKFQVVVEALEEILLNQPNHPRRHELEFMRAKSLSKLGRQGEALNAFKKLAQASGDKNGEDIWKKSAQAELEQIQWESNILTNRNQDRRSE